MRSNGGITRDPRDGGIPTRTILESGTNVVDGCAYDFEVTSDEGKPGSQYEVVCVPTYVDGFKNVLCKHLPD